ncbi:MAG: hypothetical protein CMJ53_11755 [Planctomycetaceae bacterium]|nr:hypothetical protein [Planctomycetaceae bacterium]
MKIGLLTFRRNAKNSGSTAHYIYRALSANPKNTVHHLAADHAEELAGTHLRARVFRKISTVVSLANPRRSLFVQSKAERRYTKAAIEDAEKIGCDVIIGCFCANECDLLQATPIPVTYITDINTLQIEEDESAGRVLKIEREHLMFSLSSAMVLPSQFVAESAIHEYGADPDTIHVVEWGGADMVSSELPDMGVRRSTDPFELLFIGHQRHRKGLDRAIRTVENLNAEGIGVRLLTIGRNAEKMTASPYVDDLGHLDLKNDADRKVFEGAFRRATCLLHPARGEPYGHVLVEACARSLPVVCTSVGGMPQIIRNEVNGLLISEPFDQSSLDDAVRRLVLEPELVSRLGARACLESQNRLNWSSWLDQVQPILESCTV